MQCEEVIEQLPRIVETRSGAEPELVAHVDSCLRCQAELAQYRRLLRSLHSLRTDVLEPAPGLLSDILAKIESTGERQAVRSLVTGRRVAYAGGMAAAATAGTIGVIFLASRARKARLSKAS